MEVLAEFGAYRDFGALSFPGSLTILQGGSPTLHLDFASVEPSSETVSNDAARRGGAAAPPPDPAFTEIGPGVFAFYGAYQSVAVAFDDYVAVIDGLQNDARAQELITLVKQAIPGKPIRYVVSTHSHFDHASGLRQFAAEGATILTHSANVAFFERALATPRTLSVAPVVNPNPAPAIVVQGVDERFTLSDAAGQTLELYALAPNVHAADFLIAYLPKAGVIVEADILQPWINPVFAGDGGGPHSSLVYLASELRRLGLNYESFVPIHTPPNPPQMTRGDLEEALGQP
jgi:glyoxylase-like metal-dependent hydrolase (beta-lactamase superfamily II)